MKSFYLFLLLVCFSLPSFSQINQPYGLFFIQDNQVKEGQKIFEAPTLKTDVSVKVQGLVSTTTVRQYFINPTKEHTEAIYLFPLPDKSAVDHLRMLVGDRSINGIIQKKDEAEKTYQNAKDSGKKASLISSSRTNIFKTKIANIEPGELIIVEIRYQDKLFLKNNEYSIRIPTVITHRYENSTRINIKKSNSDINLKDMLQDLRNESKIEKLNPDLHSPINENNDYTINPYAINIDLNVGFNISVPSSNEKINVNKISDTHYSINLADGTMPSTKDFVLKFIPIISPDPYVEIYGENIGDDFYLYGLVNPQIKHTDLTLTDKSSITILADVSGSMSGSSLRQMQSVLTNFINLFPDNHYLNIIAFDEAHYKLFSEPKMANKYTKQLARDFVSNFNADNGTEMLAPIYEALFENSPLPKDHQIILMTDGAISYETEAVAMVHEYIGDKRFHVVGIGSSPNSYLVKGLAKTGRGSFIYVDDFTFEEKAEELLFKINRPVIKNLRIYLEKDHFLLPKKLPDVLAGDPISFFIKIPNVSREDIKDSIILGGEQNTGNWRFEIKPNDIKKGHNLNQLWAKEKIDEIMFHNAIGFLDAGTYEDKIVDIALEHNLVTKFTSLVAVDEEIARQQSEKLNSFLIPQNIPEGWVEPNTKISSLLDLNSSFKIKSDQDLLNIDQLHEVDLNSVPSLQIHFVQTDTNKKLYYVLAILFFASFYFLFVSRRQFL